MKKNINEAIEDVAVSDMNYSTMGHVYADAIRFHKKTLEDIKQRMEEKQKDLPNEDRFAHTKINKTEELKKMRLAEDIFDKKKTAVILPKKKVLKESANNSEVATFIKDAVEGLKAGKATNYRKKLDDRLAIFVGWSAGFDADDEAVIHSVENPEFAIVAGLKVWTSDDMWTDFDWINFPYRADGEVIDISETISPSFDADKVAKYLLDSYEELKGKEISEDGEILNEAVKPVKEAFLYETGDVDTKKCKEILNDWIDWDEAGYDADEAKKQLRSLNTEGKVTEAEYDYIIKNWDDLLGVVEEKKEVKPEDKPAEKKVKNELKFGQTSYDALVKIALNYYKNLSGKDAANSIFGSFNQYDDEAAYKLLYNLAEEVVEYIGEDVEECQKYPVKSPFVKKERKGTSVQADQKYPVKSPFVKKDSQFVKKEQKAPIGEAVAEKKPLTEDAKIYLNSIDEYEPWGTGATDTWNKIVDADKVEDLDRLIEDMYPDGITTTGLNDLLAYDWEWILGELGISEDNGEELDESVKRSDGDIDISQEDADAFAERLFNAVQNGSTK